MLRFLLAALFCFNVTLRHSSAAENVANEPSVRIGEVMIYGNTVTKDNVIRDVVNIFPGQLARPSDLKKAEERLKRMGLFESPTVELENSDDEYRKILVGIRETKTSAWKREAGINSRGEPVFRLVWEERNFDPIRFPFSIDSFRDGRAFRGAGLTLRLEVLEISLVRPDRWSFFKLSESRIYRRQRDIK